MVTALRRLATARRDSFSLSDLLNDLPNWAPHTADISVRAVLRTLSAVGLIDIERTTSGLRYGRITVRSELLGRSAADSEEVESAETDGGDRGEGGGGGRGLGPIDQGGDGEQFPGAGFRDVLSHPYLFALPDDAFDTLVEQIGR